MTIPLHPTAPRRRLLVTTLLLSIFSTSITSADDINDLLQSAKPTTAPAQVTSPTAPENKPTVDALGTQSPKIPPTAAAGTITLSDGTTLNGKLWTNLDTPLRVWVEEARTYRDIDLAYIKSIEVHVLAQTMEDDWRWLKEGSDQKVYSGKKYPNLSLAYKFTLTNGQVIEGTIAGLIYLADQNKTRSLPLYKQYKGNLDETLKDLVYVSSIHIESPPVENPADKKTTHLPLLN